MQWWFRKTHECLVTFFPCLPRLVVIFSLNCDTLGLGHSATESRINHYRWEPLQVRVVVNLVVGLWLRGCEFDSSKRLRCSTIVLGKTNSLWRENKNLRWASWHSLGKTTLGHNLPVLPQTLSCELEQSSSLLQNFWDQQLPATKTIRTKIFGRNRCISKKIRTDRNRNLIDKTKQKRYFISNNREIRSETFFLELAKIKIWDWNGIFANATVFKKKMTPFILSLCISHWWQF